MPTAMNLSIFCRYYNSELFTGVPPSLFRREEQLAPSLTATILRFYYVITKLAPSRLDDRHYFQAVFALVRRGWAGPH